MHFDNSFEIAGAPDQVQELFSDPRLVAAYLPGAVVGEPDADGRYPASLTVSFGPKRITFKGSLFNEVDAAAKSGKVTGTAASDLRGAKMSVAMTYQLTPSAKGTQVVLASEAELTGMLAEFARTGGVVVTKALLDEFSTRVSAHFEARHGDPLPEAAPSAPTNSDAAAAPASLSAFRLLWQIIKSAFARTKR